MAIFSGFQNAATHRLNFSFGGVNKKIQESIENINELLSSKNSYKTYRDMLGTVNPPCIPFLYVFKFILFCFIFYLHFYLTIILEGFI